MERAVEPTEIVVHVNMLKEGGTSPTSTPSPRRGRRTRARSSSNPSDEVSASLMEANRSPRTFRSARSIVLLAAGAGCVWIAAGFLAAQNRVNYDDFAALYGAQNLKSGSPLSMPITNVRNAGYLDSRAYSDGRRLRLTAKGDQKAVQVLKRLMEKES